VFVIAIENELIHLGIKQIVKKKSKRKGKRRNKDPGQVRPLGPVLSFN
jgi:hypothetical protein